MLLKIRKWLNLACMLLIGGALFAQKPADTLVHLKDAIRLAENNYHLLKARKWDTEKARANVDVVKFSKLPSIDATYQAGFATANNLTGLFNPNGILPVTGPPSASNNYSPATGSAASVLLNWQASSFGQRDAQIAVAEAQANASRTAYEQDVFNHTINVISKYLDVVLAREQLTIQKRNVERAAANLYQSRTLAETGIKPGVDTALFLSEFSKSKIEWMNAQKQLEIQRWLLGQLMVINTLPLPTDTSFLQTIPVSEVIVDTTFSTHPLIRFAQNEIQLNKSKTSAIKKSYLPKINIWGTGFARGSGFMNDGSVKTWDGLQLSRYNYGAGVQLAFPIMKYEEVKRQLKQQDAESKAASERLQEDRSTLTTQQQIANTIFRNSIAVIPETEQQYKAGKYAFEAMQMRYGTGLVNFADLTQAQYNFLKAELDVKQAYWDAWKALLLQAIAKGDLNFFLNKIK